MSGVRYHSDFGGLWTDRHDADGELARRASTGEVPEHFRQAFQRFIADGYVVLEGAVDPAVCDRLRAEQADIFRWGSNEHLILAPNATNPMRVPPNPPQQTMRIVDLYGPSPQALDVLLAPTLVSFLTALFDEEPLLFQGLTFERGSQQGFHQDTAYVVTDPPMALAAAWIALEDIQAGSGELRYLRGSHRLPDWKFSGEHKHWNVARDGADEHNEWANSLAERAQEAGMPEERFLAKKGDVLVWSADLAHGGSPVLDEELTRRSIVGHFCPVSATPHYFNVVSNRVKLPMREAAISSIYYDFTAGYPAHTPLCIDGSTPAMFGTGEPLQPIRPMVSYAQNAEDVVLANYFGEQRRGFYIDIGANHPVDDSVTKHFYDLGWRGINVEPVAHLHALLRQHRPRDINLMVGVGAEPGMLRFDEDLDNAGLSSFHAGLSANNSAAGHRIESREVPVVTLASICAEHVTTEIDFLKVDCEGFEADVLRGHDWVRFAPRVVLAENNFPEQWHDLVMSKGYHYVLNDGLNRYYLRADLAPEGTQWRPPVRAVDQFDPWIYVSQLHQLHRRIAELTTGETVPDSAPLATPMSMPATPAPAPTSPTGRLIRRLARSAPGVWLRHRLRI